MRLLIYYLDDEYLNCDLFKDCYESDEVEVKTFLDPIEAIEETKKVKPDLFFIDFRLPKINGEEVAKLTDPSIKKILITGELSVSPVYDFLKIFYKPYKPSSVGEFIKTFL